MSIATNLSGARDVDEKVLEPLALLTQALLASHTAPAATAARLLQRATIVPELACALVIIPKE